MTPKEGEGFQNYEHFPCQYSSLPVNGQGLRKGRVNYRTGSGSQLQLRSDWKFSADCSKWQINEYILVQNKSALNILHPFDT